MKFAFLVFTLIFSTNLMAEELPGKTYDFPEVGTVLVSEARFSDADKAIEFCKSLKGETFADEVVTEMVLYAAMSGLALQDPFLEEALVFELKNDKEEISGAWFWALDQKKVTLWYDGQGYTMEAFTVEELKNRFPKEEIAVQAVCKL